MKVAMQTTDGQQGRKWQAVGTENFVGFENREEEAYSYSSTCDQEVTSYSALSTQSFPLEYQVYNTSYVMSNLHIVMWICCV